MSALPENPITLIPARMASSRLPGKPLAEICGVPMIVQVWRRACETGLGPVAVACDCPEIAEVIRAAGGAAVLTDPDIPSGSDRIMAALRELDPTGQHDAIINFQGDLPTLDPQIVHDGLALLANPAVDIATLVAPVHDSGELSNPSVVKVALECGEDGQHGQAFYFSRNPIPANHGPHWHHIGLYIYRRAALTRFVSSPPAILEQREKLEQLRALALGMRIDAAVVADVPLGVDTPEDLETARRILSSRGGAS